MSQIELLKKYNLSIRGVSGQHLLVDGNIQRKIVACIQPKKGETILEIGPGLGALTEHLLKSGAKVIAVEQDGAFVKILETELGSRYKTLKLVCADILKVDLKKYCPPRSKLKVVGNIPYYITSQILLHLIKYRTMISRAFLTIQSEVADRVLALPGTKAYGRLSILAGFYADVCRSVEISRNCFVPKPEVDSTTIGLTFHQTIPEEINEKLFFDLVKAAFGKRRKNILNEVASGYPGKRTKAEVKACLDEAKIKESARAEDLTLHDFTRLSQAITKKS